VHIEGNDIHHWCRSGTWRRQGDGLDCDMTTAISKSRRDYRSVNDLLLVLAVA